LCGLSLSAQATLAKIVMLPNATHRPNLVIMVGTIHPPSRARHGDFARLSGVDSRSRGAPVNVSARLLQLLSSIDDQRSQRRHVHDLDDLDGRAANPSSSGEARENLIPRPGPPSCRKSELGTELTFALREALHVGKVSLAPN